MAVSQRDIYNTTAGTVGFSGTGYRIVTFTGMANAIGTLDAAGNLLTPFGAGSLLRVGDRLGMVATVDSVSQVTLAHDWAGTTTTGQSYQLYTGVVGEAVMAGIYQTAGLKGTADVPFQALVWDDGSKRMRWVTDSGAIKCYAGLTRPSGGAETATNLAYSIDPATGSMTITGAVATAGGTMTGALNFAAAVTVASATTTDIGAATSNVVTISGTTTITGLGTITAGAPRWVRFSGALTLTNSAAIILPGAANITTVAGDTALFISEGSGNWRCHAYNPVGALPVNRGGTGGVTASAARTALSAAASGANGDITSLTGLTTALSVAQGGTAGNTVATATAALGINAVNLIINGCFQVNQRGYVSAAAITAAAFGHDRWKAGASGCTYTFSQLASTTTVTITAGTLTQVIEANNIEGGSITYSWLGTSQARAYQGSPTGSYSASPLTVTGLAANTNTIVEFGAGTLSNVQAQAGAVASPFVRRPFGAELLLCQRYYQEIIRGTNQTIFPPFGAKTSGGAIDFGLKFPVLMRTAPALVTSSPTFSSGAAAGTANAVAFFDPNAGYATISGSFLIVLSSSAPDCALVRLVASTSFSGTIGANGQIYIGAGYISLSAEL